MRDSTVDLLPTARLRAACLALAAGVALAAATPARADNPAATTPASTVAATTALPSTPPIVVRTPLTVRVLRVPATLTEAGARQLAAEVRTADSTTEVVIRVPDSAKADQRARQTLRRVVAPAAAAPLLVVGNPSRSHLLDDLAGAQVPLKPFESVNELRTYLGAENPQFTTVDGGTLSGPSLSALTREGATSGGPNRLVLILAALGAGALVLLVVRRSKRRRPAGTPRAMAAPSLTRTEAPMRGGSGTVRPRQASVREDPRLPSAGHALVRTELRPEGYVELANCLRRVRWADQQARPPRPGDWVEVQLDRGRLVARAQHRIREAPKP